MQPFISIFNGRRREPGADTKEVFAQLWLDALQYLHLFKGARLHVFLAIALHANEEGWSWPSYERLADETGYSRDTVCSALADLCKLEVDGERVLLRYQPQAEEVGKFESNRYLIFPNAEAVEKYEGAGVFHRAGDTGGQFGDENRVGKTTTREPCRGFPCTEKSDTNKNHFSSNHGNDDDDEHGKNHDAHAAQEAEPEPERTDEAAAIAALRARGWNDTQAATERFVADVGADVILDMHAKKPRNIRAGYFRKHAPTWVIRGDNGRDAVSSSRRTGTDSGKCPECDAIPCMCDVFAEWDAEEQAEQAAGAAH